MPGPYELGYDGYQMLLDYDVRTDKQPVFQGYAAIGVPTSLAAWTIYKYVYDGSGRPTSRQVAMNAIWDNRSTSVVYA